MAFDFEATPKLRALFDGLNPRPAVHRRRVVSYVDSLTSDDRRLVAAVGELDQPGVAEGLSADELTTLGRLVVGSRDASRAAMMTKVRAVLDRRWSELAGDMAAIALLTKWHGREIFDAFPRLAEAPELLDHMDEAIEAQTLSDLDRHLDLRRIAAPTPDQLRRLLPSAAGELEDSLGAYLIIAASRSAGWTPWLKLFTILFHAPGLAAEPPGAAPPPVQRAMRPDANEAVRREVWAAVRPDRAVRMVARLVMDLGDTLRQAPPDVWPAYVNRLRAGTAQDGGLREAAIEAMIWRGRELNRDLAVFAAANLAGPQDLPLLDTLTQHPDRGAGYEAQLIKEALQGPLESEPLWFPSAPAARTSAVSQVASAGPDFSRTWLGQALFERSIEQTVAELEESFARTYPAHHGDGEEKLGERFFTTLGSALQRLSETHRENARAFRAERLTQVVVRYRPVDKLEESEAGIRRPDIAGDAPPFSADFCIVVEAVLRGKPLTRRATLVQAKRLYARDRNDRSPKWKASFALEPKQTDALLRQTDSSFYLFQGPSQLGRGLPIIPARLVDDLARHQGPSRKNLTSETVRRASQSFSEWFTYELIALRTGDPLKALLDKAERGPGSTPYDLARFGVVELEVRVDEPSKVEG